MSDKISQIHLCSCVIPITDKSATGQWSAANTYEGLLIEFILTSYWQGFPADPCRLTRQLACLFGKLLTLSTGWPSKLGISIAVKPMKILNQLSEAEVPAPDSFFVFLKLASPNFNIPKLTLLISPNSFSVILKLAVVPNQIEVLSGICLVTL